MANALCRQHVHANQACGQGEMHAGSDAVRRYLRWQEHRVPQENMPLRAHYKRRQTDTTGTGRWVRLVRRIKRCVTRIYRNLAFEEGGIVKRSLAMVFHVPVRAIATRRRRVGLDNATPKGRIPSSISWATVRLRT